MLESSTPPARAPQQPPASEPDLAPPRQQKLPEILPLTALRGWLAWWVALYHLHPLFESLWPTLTWPRRLFLAGDFAVDVFFLLSGFVIALTYEAKLRGLQIASYRAFLWARLSRLYPVHIAHQLLWLLLVTAGAYLGRSGLTWSSLEPWGFVLNAFLVNAWGIPMRMYWNYPAWSVSLEWAAYLLAPWLLLLARQAGRWLGGRAVLALALWACLMGTYQVPGGQLVRIFAEFTLGALLASWFRDGQGSSLTWLYRARWPLLVALAVGATSARLLETSYYPVVPIAAVAILALAQAPAHGRGPALHAAVYVGRISYSLYMSHALSITVMHQVVHPSHHAGAALATRLAVTAAYLLAIFVGAAATYHVVEKPLQRRLRNLHRASSPATAVELPKASIAS